MQLQEHTEPWHILWEVEKQYDQENANQGHTL